MPQQQPLIIALSDGREIRAQRLTSTNYLALAGLIWEEGTEFPEDLTSPSAKNALAGLMFRRLRDPEYIKSLAYAILSIFPTIPDDLVWFDDPQQTPRYGIGGLELEDVLLIVERVSSAVKAPAPVPTPDSDPVPTDSPDLAPTRRKVARKA